MILVNPFNLIGGIDMKRLGLILFMLLLVITGCSSQRNDLILLTGRTGISETVEINRETLVLKLDNNEDFILFLSNPTCSACINFKPVINSWIAESEAVIYRIEVNVTDLIAYRYTPTLVVIKGGEVVAKQDPTTAEQVFARKADLEDFVTKYASLPKLFEVSIDQLRAKIAAGDDFVVYYSWYMCSDCNYLYDNFFKEYLTNTELEKKIFFIELDPWRDLGRTTDKWKAFAAEFKIDSYGDGRTPTFQFVSNGEASEMIVVFNEIFSANEALTAVTVTKSFHQDFPFMGKTYSGEGIADAVNKYRADTSKFHTDKLKDFLNRNLAKAD
jgi:hypothetical protein